MDCGVYGDAVEHALESPRPSSGRILSLAVCRDDRMTLTRRVVSLFAKSGATAGLFGLLISLAACGGNPSSPTAPSPPSVPPITVYEPGNGVSIPTLVRDVKPSYTAQAIAARIQGTVLMSAVVLADGTVGEVMVVRSLDTRYGLDAQAVSAAKQWLFNPGQRDGVAVAVRVTIEMSFTPDLKARANREPQEVVETPAAIQVTGQRRTCRRCLSRLVK